MLRHVLECYPEEACGLIGGKGAQARRVLPVVNALHSPTAFRMDPAGQIAALWQLDAAGLDLTAIYHSHPLGPALPSPTDLAEFAYPGAAYVIWSPAAEGGWQARAYAVDAVGSREIDLFWIEET